MRWLKILTIRDHFNAARDKRKAMTAVRVKPIPLRPDPEYRRNRLAQFSPERRARYWRNVAGL